jgi:hypothetical protein
MEERDRPIKALRSPVVHCVYARIEKSVTDWIVYRGDRPAFIIDKVNAIAPVGCQASLGSRLN